MTLKNLDKSHLYLIHHSDRGVQYCCKKYIEVLKKNGIKISMTEQYDPYENAIAERINRTIKEEFLDTYLFFKLIEVLLLNSSAFTPPLPLFECIPI